MVVLRNGVIGTRGECESARVKGAGPGGICHGHVVEAILRHGGSANGGTHKRVDGVGCVQAAS